MSVEIRYTFVGYKVTDTAIKHTIKKIEDVYRIAESLYGDQRDDTVCLIIDDRFFTGYTKKALQRASGAILHLLDIAQLVELDVLLVVRRTLSGEVYAKAGMINNVTEYINDTKIQTQHPHIRIMRKPTSFVNEAVMRRADYFTYVINDTPKELPARGVELNPLLECPCVALLGDLHQMESSDITTEGTDRLYRFRDAVGRYWTVRTPTHPVAYDEALGFIDETPLLKRHLDMFYDSTTEPVKPSKEVLNMLLPWGLVVTE